MVIALGPALQWRGPPPKYHNSLLRTSSWNASELFFFVIDKFPPVPLIYTWVLSLSCNVKICLILHHNFKFELCLLINDKNLLRTEVFSLNYQDGHTQAHMLLSQSHNIQNLKVRLPCLSLIYIFLVCYDDRSRAAWTL